MWPTIQNTKAKRRGNDKYNGFEKMLHILARNDGCDMIKIAFLLFVLLDYQFCFSP